ncbi:unnamed protein product [Adineta steineri]|uniref:FYVE-type domain-containing protein n=2 Tax=Adineta steineri TaxID=433720 RepID=A0A818G7P1_9BILA|nr:unnamed protein product [Adineta steineri]
MSVLEIRHEFVDIETRDNQQLYQAFCNHIYLGQWELCRICLQILFTKRLKLNTNLEDLLIDIIRNPTAYCTGSKSVPTPFHFALLLVEECRVNQYLDATIVEELKHYSTFKFLLAVGDIQPSAQVAQEFERLHKNTDDIPSTLLTDSMADFLVDLWLHETPRVHAFIRLYLYSSIPSIHTWLIQIHKRALEICLQQLKTLNNEQQKTNLVDLLLALHFYSCDTNEFRLTIRDTLRKIVIYATEGNDNSGQLFDLKTLYRSILNNGYLARFISELESDYRKELLNNDTVIIHFLKKNSFRKENFFWKEIYLYLIENKLDLISCVLNDSILMIQSRDYSSLDQLLNIEQFKSLHLYIFLLGWTHVRTVNDAIVLYDSINALPDKCSMLSKSLELFQSHIEFITWLYNIRRIDLYHDGVTNLPNMSSLLSKLQTTSPLSLIHEYLDIQTIDSKEILDKLQKTLVDIDDENDKSNEKKRVRFLDAPFNTIESHRLSQTTSSMIFLGYLSVNTVIERILSSDNHNPETDIFSLTRTYLTQIYPLRFRLELLENLFSLVFIQSSDLKIDDAVEIIEQLPPSTPSLSLTTSDKLFSSIQSNLTNDSFQTSTNASIKTQLSIRRFDNELDENTDDNLSVCSSSMSSVGASHHHPINRSGLLINQYVLYHLLIFLRDQLTEVRALHQKIKDKATDRDTVDFETLLDKYFHGCSIHTNEQFASRATKLNTIVSETLWRYQLLTANKNESSTEENKNDEQENDNNLINNPIIKNLILPIPVHRHAHRRKRRKRLSESSISSAASSSYNGSSNNTTRTKSTLVSQILSTRDNLLAICLKEGKITEANEVIRLFNMQDHPLAVEAKFSKLFHDTVIQLSATDPSVTTPIENFTSNSPLAGLNNLVSSALNNSFVQQAMSPLLEAVQTSNVSSTLPTSTYFDHEHFLSLTLFDLAINARTMTISKTLLDMAQHRLPIPRPLFSSNTSSHNNQNNRNSPSRIKNLSDMINNYSQLANSSNGSFYDLLLDVTIPLDAIKATKTIQYYKRLDEHCRQYYINEQNSLPIEEQVKNTGEFFENDPQAKVDLIAYIRNSPNQTKLSSSSYINYFSIFHTYLQNFRTLLEKFPVPDIPSDVDLSKYSPLSLIHRIVARSTDIDLAQLQLMTSKLNIDISLAVSLNIIRPLFVDKTIATSSLSSNRRTTLLQQQPINIFSNRQQFMQQKQSSHSLSNESTKAHMRKSTTFFKRLASKLGDFQNEPQSFNEHPEKFIRTLLTKLLDSIRKLIQESNHSHMMIEHIEKLLALDDYDNILNALPLLTYLDLDRLMTNEERICFFTNLYNFLIIIFHIELIRTTITTIQVTKTTTNIFRNELERLLFLLTTRIDIGQLKQISLYDIKHYILKENILTDGLKFDIDPTAPYYQYAPTIQNNQHIKIGLILNGCMISSTPFIVLTPELLNDQLQRSTRDFIDKCVTMKTNETDNSIEILVPYILHKQFDQTNDDMIKFIGEYSSNNNILCAITEQRKITTEIIPCQTDFALSFEYRLCSSLSERHQRRRRTSSLPTSTTITTLSPSIDFLSQTTTLPNHLIDSRTISFVQEKSPALGQILQIYVQSVVHNQAIEDDKTPLKTYFTSLLLSPTLIQSTTAIGDEWFRSIVLNDLTYQHDLLLYLCSLLWNDSKYTEIVQLFDSLLPSFIVHSSYCQILRDLALLSLIKQTSEPDHAYHYLRKIHDCHLLIHATLTYLPRFDGPTCLKLLELCLTSCKKYHSDYIDWIQERLNIMYVYKTLCLGALSQFTKCMENISKLDTQLNLSIEDMAIKKTSSKCLTWQRAEEHSQRDPLAVVDMFIFEKQFDMGHKWLTLLNKHVDEDIINRVRFKLVEEHIHWLLNEENIGNGNKFLQIIDTITNINDKWQLCTDLINDLSRQRLVTSTKSIPFSRLFIKFRLIQYMLAHFEENSTFFQGQYDRSKLCVLVTGLAIFFNCIPLEQTDSYEQLVGQPLLILEQLLMNSSIDIAKITIETLKVLIEKYSLENIINMKQIDQLIEIYTKKSVRLNVVQPHEETPITVENKPVLQPPPNPLIERRRSSLNPATYITKRKGSQDLSPLGRRTNNSGTNNFFNSIRHRMSPRTPITSPNVPESDLQTSSPSTIASSPNTNSPPMSHSIPIKSQQQQQTSSSFFDHFSSSFTNKSNINDQSHQGHKTTEYTVPLVIPTKKLWVSDDEVAVCMCCNETHFSMFNRRHHCRRCGRVVCKPCSQHMTIIKGRSERTCKGCYQYMQNNPAPPTTSRPEINTPTKKFENLRSLSRPIHSKKHSISQVYLKNNRSYTIASNNHLLGTSLVAETSSILVEDTLLLSSSVSTGSPLSKNNKLNYRSSMDTPQTQDNTTDAPAIPIITDQVQYQLTGTSNDDSLRNDFHYDQSPSISLCLSLIELHSNQYECGKLLIKLCEYLSEQLSTKQRNTEIDYGLVLNIIKNLLFTAKMKLTTSYFTDEESGEQQKLLRSCEIYNNLIDILNRLNMANCSLPALNDLLQQDTLRKIRNQLLEDERYQLAMDISTKCNLDTQTIWFQWGMAYLHIGQYGEARDKFDKCLQKTSDTTDKTLKQLQRGGVSQEKIVNDIIAFLESSRPLKYSMRNQYLSEQQIRQSGQTRASLKYLNSLSTIPRLPDKTNKAIENEILFYLTIYSDDGHLLDYYIRHEYYTQAFEYKCSLVLFRDHIYLPLLKRNHIKHLFNYILSHNLSLFTHHLKFICTYLKEQEMNHSLLQLQLFLNDYLNAGFTSVKLFTINRTTYLDLFEKRSSYLQKGLEYFLQAKADTEQTMMKIHSTKSKIELQLEITRYIYGQLKRLNTNGSNILINCPTLFDGKDSIIKLILGLITISDTMTTAFSLINKIINELNLSINEVFLPCAEEIGKRRDYRMLQQLLQVMRDNGYNDNKLHDDIIESCVRQTGSDVEQSREQDTLIQMIKNDNTRINVYISVGKLRAAYLIAIRLGKEDKIRLIRDDAQRSGQTAVYEMCKKWLENRASEQ